MSNVFVLNLYILRTIIFFDFGIRKRYLPVSPFQSINCKTLRIIGVVGVILKINKFA
jgi:hypothetical protein